MIRDFLVSLGVVVTIALAALLALGYLPVQLPAIDLPFDLTMVSIVNALSS